MIMIRDDDDSSTTSSGSDIFSPFAPLRSTRSSAVEESSIHRSETLPVHHDSSWLGARMSPIAFDDDEEQSITAPYQKALNDSMDSSFANERSALLGKRKSPDNSKSPAMRNGDVNGSNVSHSSRQSSNARLRWPWGTIICVLSGTHLACMALHDLYCWYLSYRLGYVSTKDIRWTFPWLAPSASTLQRFGALVPWQVIQNGQSWRMFTSLLVSTSVMEYGLVCWAWRALRTGGRASPGIGLFLMSAVTGQLWTLAWNASSVSGGASWGTSGVLCAAGLFKPRQRFVVIVISVALVVLSLFQPTTSVMGSLGSSFFGWVYCGMGHVVSHRDKDSVMQPNGPIRWLSGIVLLSLWIVPLFWIASFPGLYDLTS